MSLLLAWISRVSDGKASAVYIAGDSRITSENHKWNHGKKVFCAKSQPWIFGFCGSVLVPTQIISELTDAIDSGLVVRCDQTANANWKAIKDYLQRALSGSQPFLAKEPTYIFGFYRQFDGTFDSGYYTLNGTTVSFTHIRDDLKTSTIIKVLGSGEKCFNDIAAETRAKNSSVDVTRIFFASFCRAIRSGNVASVGGTAQLATLRTAGPGQLVPILFDKVLFHQGVETDTKWYSNDCFDETLQRINPQTGELREGAQRQPLN
jgi:hypothetical protein